MDKILEWCKHHNATFIAQGACGFYYAIGDDMWYCPYEEM